MIKQFFILSVSSLLLLFSCNTDDDSSDPTVTSQIVFKPTVNGLPYNISDSVTYSNGTTLRYDEFRFYICNVIVEGTNGEEVYLDSVELIDFNNPGSETFNINLASGSYEKIKFGIGLSDDLNQTEPTLVPADHPLGTHVGMHWPWAALYKFISLSGFYSTTPTSNLENTFNWHPGRSQMFREVELNLNQKHFYDDTVLEIELDVIGMLERTAIVDVHNEPSWHGTPLNNSVAEKIVDNFAASLKIKN